jgi:hypothetical protein
MWRQPRVNDVRGLSSIFVPVNSHAGSFNTLRGCDPAVMVGAAKSCDEMAGLTAGWGNMDAG